MQLGVVASMSARVVLGDCREILKTFDSDSFDSLVTDPPAGISFMGKAWDSYESLHHFQAEMTEVFRETLRCLKPGAHGLVWALPRTSGFTMMALVDAGFEVRDSIVHLFGSGMPKGLNVAKAGAGPEWEGWNTTLKPAHEIWWLVRKPLNESTVVKQVLATGTGVINVAGCRIPLIGAEEHSTPGRYKDSGIQNVFGAVKGDPKELQIERAKLGGNPRYDTSGRWPANAVLSHAESCVEGECSEGCAVQALDEQSGVLTSGGGDKGNKHAPKFKGVFQTWDGHTTAQCVGDRGGASRFFYTSKLPAKERKLPDGTTNQHPTAKSIKLMRYFVRLITPPAGTVLDPFAGSGTTGVAALREGFHFVGIERDAEHHRVSQLRLDAEMNGIFERMAGLDQEC